MAPAIPDRWLNYKPIGKRIEGTRFIAFKVPLRQHVVKSVEADIRLDNEGLLKDIPNLGLIIDLTNTNRYYNPDFFRSQAVEYKKLMIPGHVTPTEDLVNRFKLYVMSFLNSNKDNDKLIGVHCTHGVNRTGYLICNYMISELSIDSKEAIKRFDTARGHHIERQNYLQSLQDLTDSSYSVCPRIKRESRAYNGDKIRTTCSSNDTHYRNSHELHRTPSKYSQEYHLYQRNAGYHKDSYQRRESHYLDRRSNQSHKYPTHNNASSSRPTNDYAAYRNERHFSSYKRDESRNRFSNNDN